MTVMEFVDSRPHRWKVARPEPDTGADAQSTRSRCSAVGMNRAGPETLAEEARDVLAWQNHRDRAALDRIVRAHERIIGRIAVYYAARYALDKDDLFQAGVAKFIEYLDDFDVTRGVLIVSYMQFKILPSVEEEAVRQKCVVQSMPVEQIRRRLKYVHTPENGTWRPSPREAVDWQQSAQQVRSGLISLQAPVNDEPDTGMRQTRGDILPAPELTPEDRVAGSQRDDVIRRCLAYVCQDLSEKQRLVLVRRHGGMTPDREENAGDSFQAIAKICGETSENIRQIYRTALGKVRARREELVRQNAFPFQDGDDVDAGQPPASAGSGARTQPKERI